MTPENRRYHPGLPKPEFTANLVRIARKLSWTGNVIPINPEARLQRETSRRDLALLNGIVPPESLEQISDFIKNFAEVHGRDAAVELLSTITDEIRLSKKGDQPIANIVRTIIVSHMPF